MKHSLSWPGGNVKIDSWAQNFEDVMLWRALGHVENGFYLDIGAQDPSLDSVSRAFHDAGWRGIHIEATPRYAELLREARPGDRVIQAAVSDVPGIILFEEFANTGLSTGDAALAARYRNEGRISTGLMVPAITLANVFETIGDDDIHWMKIDVEGMEEKVIAGWDVAPHRPWVLVIESVLPLSNIPTHAAWEGAVLKRGYTNAYCDGLNRFYVSDDHRDLISAFSTPPGVFDLFTVAPSHWAAQMVAETTEIEIATHRAAYGEAISALNALSDRADGWQQQLVERSAACENMQKQLVALEGDVAALTSEIVTRDIALDQERAERVALAQQLADEGLRADAIAVERESLERRLFGADNELHRLRRQIDALANEITASANVAREREAMLSTIEEDCNNLRLALKDEASLAHTKRTELAAAGLDLERTKYELRASETALNRLEQQIAGMQASRAWRWLGPLRGRHHHVESQRRDALGRTAKERTAAVLTAPDGGPAQSFDDLMLSHDAAFIRRAYVTLLRRQPDAEGASYHLYRLRAGVPRITILNQLIHSSEAASIDTVLPGLISALKRARLARLPLLNRLFECDGNRPLDYRLRRVENYIYVMMQGGKQPDNEAIEPRVISDGDLQPATSLADILADYDLRFLVRAYRTILGRDPDPKGQSHYLKLLRAGAGKIQTLEQLRYSDEGRTRRVALEGLASAIRRARLARMPLVGRAFQVVLGGEGAGWIERYVRKVENMAYSAGRTGLPIPEVYAAVPDAMGEVSHPVVDARVSPASAYHAGLPLLSAAFTPRARAIFLAVRKAEAERVA